jgi:hypothetical protein
VGVSGGGWRLEDYWVAGGGVIWWVGGVLAGGEGFGAFNGWGGGGGS